MPLLLRLVSTPVSLVNDAVIYLFYLAREFMFLILFTVVVTSCKFLLEKILDLVLIAFYLFLAEGKRCLLLMNDLT